MAEKDKSAKISWWFYIQVFIGSIAIVYLLSSFFTPLILNISGSKNISEINIDSLKKITSDSITAKFKQYKTNYSTKSLPKNGMKPSTDTNSMISINTFEKEMNSSIDSLYHFEIIKNEKKSNIEIIKKLEIWDIGVKNIAFLIISHFILVLIIFNLWKKKYLFTKEAFQIYFSLLALIIFIIFYKSFSDEWNFIFFVMIVGPIFLVLYSSQKKTEKYSVLYDKLDKINSIFGLDKIHLQLNYDSDCKINNININTEQIILNYKMYGEFASINPSVALSGLKYEIEKIIIYLFCNKHECNGYKSIKKIFSETNNPFTIDEMSALIDLFESLDNGLKNGFCEDKDIYFILNEMIPKLFIRLTKIVANNEK